MWEKIGKTKKYLIAGSFFLHVGQFIRGIFRKCRQRIDFLLGFIVRKIVYRKGPIQNNKIVVRTFDNRYSCNPKYIVEEILKRDLPFDIVWVTPPKGNAGELPLSVRQVKHGSYTMYDEMASAKIWIDNALNFVWEGMPKKKGQIYLNTWHGSLGIKKLNGNRTWMHRAKRCNKNTDYCISNSLFEENVYQETFWRDVPYLRYGHARNDMFFDEGWMELLRRKVCSFFELDTSTKILLYAPTFRDDGAMEWCNIDFERLKASLETRFGGEWCILLRMHFKNRTRNALIEESWLKNASKYEDMQELLAAADVGITDYSSWAYDYILTGRPLFLYAPDLEAYDQKRGFYYPLESTPFPIAEDNDALEKNILAFDEQAYLEKREIFLKEKGCIEDGHASERIVNKIIELARDTAELADARF